MLIKQPTPTDINTQFIITIIATGYAGADFIEGFFNTTLSKISGTATTNKCADEVSFRGTVWQVFIYHFTLPAAVEPGLPVSWATINCILLANAPDLLREGLGMYWLRTINFSLNDIERDFYLCYRNVRIF